MDCASRPSCSLPSRGEGSVLPQERRAKKTAPTSGAVFQIKNVIAIVLDLQSSLLIQFRTSGLIRQGYPYNHLDHMPNLKV